MGAPPGVSGGKASSQAAGRQRPAFSLHNWLLMQTS
jgi:hypothetical protein